MDTLRTTGCVNCLKTKIPDLDAYQYKCRGLCSGVIDTDSLTKDVVKNPCSDRGGCCGGPIDGKTCDCNH